MEYKTDKLRPTQPFLVLETQDFKQEIYLNQGISHFYTFRLEKTKEITTVPDSCVDMLFEYGENGMTAYAIGSPIKALDVEWQGKKEYFGVRFMPGSMPVGLNVTLRDLVDCRFYLEDILLDNNGTFVSGMKKKKTFKDRINYFLRMVKLYSGKVCDLQLASEEEDIAGSLSFLKGKEKELLLFLMKNYRGEFTPIEISRELSVTNKTVINRLTILVKNGFVIPILVNKRIRSYELSEFTKDHEKKIIKAIS